jgi:hypothetical protein
VGIISWSNTLTHRYSYHVRLQCLSLSRVVHLLVQLNTNLERLYIDPSDHVKVYGLQFVCWLCFNCTSACELLWALDCECWTETSRHEQLWDVAVADCAFLCAVCGVWIWGYSFCAYLFELTWLSDVAVRGMMYYRRALELQAFLDMATEDGTFSTA